MIRDTPNLRVSVVTYLEPGEGVVRRQPFGSVAGSMYRVEKITEVWERYTGRVETRETYSVRLDGPRLRKDGTASGAAWCDETVGRGDIWDDGMPPEVAALCVGAAALRAKVVE